MEMLGELFDVNKAVSFIMIPVATVISNILVTGSDFSVFVYFRVEDFSVFVYL
jgi:hypothetical protein